MTMAVPPLMPCLATANVLMSIAPVVINEKACKIISVQSFWLQFRKILKHMPNSLRADVTKVNYLGINSGTSLSVLLN